mmetsp:Transcript_9144/g.805  ORF Transcript_9144/g.805 Transcript_9144/m.805 type:complete len:84 (-) Transcript_9144:678-929(-)
MYFYKIYNWVFNHILHIIKPYITTIFYHHIFSVYIINKDILQLHQLQFRVNHHLNQKYIIRFLNNYLQIPNILCYHLIYKYYR